MSSCSVASTSASIASMRRDQAVRADAGPRFQCVDAAVEVDAPRAVRPAVRGESAAADCAHRANPESRYRDDRDSRGRRRHTATLALAALALRGGPELVGHDPQLRRRHAQPVVLRPFASAAPGPSCRASGTGSRRSRPDTAGGAAPRARCSAPTPPDGLVAAVALARPSAFSVFVMRVSPAPAAHSSKMRRTTAASTVVDAPLDVRALAVGAEDLDVVVAEDAPAGDMAGARLPLHRVVRPLPRLLALELVGERGQATA